MLTEQIDHKLIQDSLNSSKTKGKSHHGYSFEDFVILAFGFTEADGSPYRDHRQGGTAKWGQPFDVPQEVVARNPIIPEEYKLPWSIKAVSKGGSIGLGTARTQHEAWTKTGMVQVTAVYSKENGKKILEHFSIKVIKPSNEYFGNLTKKLLDSLDPVANGSSKDGTYDRKQFEQEVSVVNRSRSGVIGVRAMGRLRNLQAYIGFKDYFELVA